MARGKFLKEEYAKLAKYESVGAWEDELGGKSESTLQNTRYALCWYILWGHKNTCETKNGSARFSFDFRHRSIP